MRAHPTFAARGRVGNGNHGNVESLMGMSATPLTSQGIEKTVPTAGLSTIFSSIQGGAELMSLVLPTGPVETMVVYSYAVS